VKNRDVVSLVGASVLSGAGSLPLHLAPLIITVLVIDGRASIADAGWIATAVLLGQFTTALVLPLLDVRIIARGPAIGLALTLLLGLVLSGLAGMPGLLGGWFVVGVCCGGLQYLGTITAATHSRPAFAFPIRLGVVLCLAGVTAGALQWTAGLGSYREMLVVLVAVFSLILLIGIVLHHPIEPQRRILEKDAQAGSLKFFALGVVFVLFVGQSGLFAYVVQGATDRGIVLRDASWALAIMKIAAGACLLLLARKGLQNRQNPRFVELGALLAISNFVVATTTDPLVFFLGLLGLEIGFNLLSARLQARVSDIAPYFGGQWLVATMLLGAASGPALHGFAIRVESDAAFVAFAMLSALVPAALLIARPKDQTETAPRP
jgi:hypothetical protein